MAPNIYTRVFDDYVLEPNEPNQLFDVNEFQQWIENILQDFHAAQGGIHNLQGVSDGEEPDEGDLGGFSAFFEAPVQNNQVPQFANYEEELDQLLLNELVPFLQEQGLEVSNDGIQFLLAVTNGQNHEVLPFANEEEPTQQILNGQAPFLAVLNEDSYEVLDGLDLIPAVLNAQDNEVPDGLDLIPAVLNAQNNEVPDGLEFIAAVLNAQDNEVPDGQDNEAPDEQCSDNEVPVHKAISSDNDDEAEHKEPDKTNESVEEQEQTNKPAMRKPAGVSHGSHSLC